MSIARYTGAPGLRLAPSSAAPLAALLVPGGQGRWGPGRAPAANGPARSTRASNFGGASSTPKIAAIVVEAVQFRRVSDHPPHRSGERSSVGRSGITSSGKASRRIGLVFGPLALVAESIRSHRRATDEADDVAQAAVESVDAAVNGFEVRTVERLRHRGRGHLWLTFVRRRPRPISLLIGIWLPFPSHLAQTIDAAIDRPAETPTWLIYAGVVPIILLLSMAAVVPVAATGSIGGEVPPRSRIGLAVVVTVLIVSAAVIGERTEEIWGIGPAPT